MAGKFFLGENAQSFKTSPKFPAVDMVVLNLDENAYVSSPYVQIDEETWESGPLRNRNGEFVFYWDVSTSRWYYGGTSRPLSEYGITVVYAENTPQEKEGDKIVVTRFADTTDAQNPKIELNIELTRSGRAEEINCPLVKASERQALADEMLRQLSGRRYQPFTASGAEVNPLMELGDGILVHGVYSGMYQQQIEFNSMMTSDIGAPGEEETESEYKYETASERRYSRKFADISAEFEITATQIAARVTKTGGNASSFAWELLDDHWKVLSNNREVFRVDDTGAHVTGEITAQSGYIGTEQSGFAITASAIFNGVTAADGEQQISLSNISDGDSRGVYIGTDGIYMGGGKFRVTNSGAVRASNIEIVGGSISIGDKFSVDSAGNLNASSGTFTGSIYASNLKSDAVNGYGGSFSGAGLTGGSISYSSASALASKWYSGASYGNGYGLAIVNGTSSYPSIFTAGTLYARTQYMAKFGGDSGYLDREAGSTLMTGASISSSNLQTINVMLADGSSKSIVVFKSGYSGALSKNYSYYAHVTFRF